MARKTKTTPDETVADAIEEVATDGTAADIDPAAAADADKGTATDDATAATDGTEVDRANPRPSAEGEGDAQPGEADVSSHRLDAAAPASSTESASQGNADEARALVPEDHVAIVFLRNHVIDDGLQGTLRETRFEEGARHVMSLASARHFTSRGIAVDLSRTDVADYRPGPDHGAGYARSGEGPLPRRWC